MSPATKATRGGAEPTAAGVVLQQMHRRLLLSRLGVWGALAAGPVSLVLWSLTPTPPPVDAPAPSRSSSPRSAARAAVDPRGFAEVFTTAWLRSSGDEAQRAQSRLAQAMAPGVQLPEPADGAQGAQSVTAVRSAQHARGRWSVTVAAQYPGGTLRYFAVPVAVGAGGGAFVVERAPGRIAAPPVAKVPASPYRTTLDGDGELASTAGEFLTAYLAGDGRVERYLAPGVRLRAVASAPYDTVEVDEAAADTGRAAAGQVPADGTRVRVLARATAKDATGVWPLSYELVLSARAGRWEIAALPAAAGGGGS